MNIFSGLRSRKRYNYFNEGWTPVQVAGFRHAQWTGNNAQLKFPAQKTGYSLKFSGPPFRSTRFNIYYNGEFVQEHNRDMEPVILRIPPGTDRCDIKIGDRDWIDHLTKSIPVKMVSGMFLKNISPGITHESQCRHNPHLIEMSMTGRCNINPPCLMCVTRNLKSRQDKLSLPPIVYKRMYRYLNDTQLITLHGGEGEPLLSPDLLNVLERIDTRNIYTLFNSNGLLLSEDKIEGLIRTGLVEINVSLDAATPSTYRKIRNNDGFQNILDNIGTLNKFKKLNKTDYPIVVLNMVLMKENFMELPKLVELAKELEVSTIHTWFLVPAPENIITSNKYLDFNYYEQRLDPNSEEFKKTIRNARLTAESYGIDLRGTNPEIAAILNEEVHRNNYSGKPNTVDLFFKGTASSTEFTDDEDTPPCQIPWKQILVDMRGDVKFCCHALEYLGNLTERKFQSIWNGPEAQRIRSQFLDKKLPDACSACPSLLDQSDAWKQ